MVTNFAFKKVLLEVSFRDLSIEVPEGSEYLWDFGDLKVSNERNPVHTYDESGFYVVTLTITTPAIPDVENKPGKKQFRLGVSDLSKTQLSDTIYNLINVYIPDGLLAYLSDIDKQVYIEKWQLYLQPLVNHVDGMEIPEDEYNNELAYEALENQLIMELSAYDFLTVGIINMMRSATDIVQEDSSSTEAPEGTEGEDGKQRIKSIVTGPTEVQFYEGLSGDSASSLAKTITSAMQPGGVIDTLKQNICMLAQRIGIYLPICSMPKITKVPRIINKRVATGLSGPNPTIILK